MIKRLYGEHYHIWTLRVEPADVGHAGVNRERLYLILSLANEQSKSVALYNSIAASRILSSDG